MMSRKVALTDAWTVPDPFGGTTHVVELRCRAEAQGAVPARVRFVLGGRGRSPAGVLPAAWAPTGELQPLDVDEVRLVLPRLSLRTRLDVTPHLAGLGLAHCFGDLADLSGIGPAPLALGQVAQETVVKVAEEGIEAAAATAAMVWMGMARQHRVESIVFDRPFGIVVLDGTAEVPLFTAWQATTPVDPEGASYECLEGDDPNPASVRRVTFVPFLPDGRCAAVIGDGGELLLPSGDVLPGEDWRLDTAARVPLETAGYYRRRVRPFAYDAADQRVYAWLEGDRYRGRRPHAEPELFTDDPEAVAAILPYGPRRAVLDAARSYRAQDDA
jgi:hypothetical protein